jgi:hypothetical protein
MKYRTIVFVIALLTFGCNRAPEKLSIQDYSSWLSDEENGIYKSRQINGVTIDARFLPAELQAYKEYKANALAYYDSILQSYTCGLTFQIELYAEKSDKVYGNLLYYGVADEHALNDRTRYLNFNAAEFITLTYGDKVYEPVLSNFEGYNSIGNKINFIVVFELSEYMCGVFKSDSQNEIKLTFKDPYWDLGINHFEFEKKDILLVPKLKY